MDHHPYFPRLSIAGGSRFRQLRVYRGLARVQRVEGAVSDSRPPAQLALSLSNTQVEASLAHIVACLNAGRHRLRHHAVVEDVDYRARAALIERRSTSSPAASGSTRTTI